MTGRAPDSAAGGRVGLRRWTREDAEWYAEQASEAEIQKWTIERADVCPEHVAEAIESLGCDATAWAVVDLVTGERLGNASVELLGEVASATYWVAKPARGRGVATEALRLMIDESALRGAQRMELEIHQENVSSRRVADKLGFTAVGQTSHPELGPCVRYSLRLRSTGESRA